MLTVFAVIGVLFTIAFIVFSIDNSNKSQTSRSQLRSNVITKESPEVKLCTFIIATTVRAIQEDVQVRNLRGLARENRIKYILSECLIGCLATKNVMAIEFDLSPTEVQKHINWSFSELRKKYLR